MKKEELEKLDIILREVEMDEYLNEETLPKIREALGIMHKLQQYQTKENWISVDEIQKILVDYSEWLQANEYEPYSSEIPKAFMIEAGLLE